MVNAFTQMVFANPQRVQTQQQQPLRQTSNKLLKRSPTSSTQTSPRKIRKSSTQQPRTLFVRRTPRQPRSSRKKRRKQQTARSLTGESSGSLLSLHSALSSESARLPLSSQWSSSAS